MDVYVKDTSGEEFGVLYIIYIYIYFILRYVEPSPGFRGSDWFVFSLLSDLCH